LFFDKSGPLSVGEGQDLDGADGRQDLRVLGSNSGSGSDQVVDSERGHHHPEVECPEIGRVNQSYLLTVRFG